MKKIGLILVAVFAMVFTACEKDDENDNMFVDGTYYAEQSEFSHGWKAFVEAEIQDDELVAVDFDYFDADGGLKSETTVENYPMDPHPTTWLPQYEAALLAADISSFTEVDVITGATGAWGNVNALMTAILDAAEDGNTADLIVTIE
jgi:major membrane immunogen (membrane-anchored lipoprotein)